MLGTGLCCPAEERQRKRAGQNAGKRLFHAMVLARPEEESTRDRKKRKDAAPASFLRCCVEPGLTAQAEVGDEFAVTLDVDFLQITEQTAALSDLQKKAAAAVMILFMDLQMFG